MNDNCTLIIKALGSFSISIGNDEIKGFDRTRLQELLVYLLLKPGQPIQRSQIAFIFWPETPQKQAFSNLRNLIYYLRLALFNSEEFIDTDSQSITWRKNSPYWFDVAEFTNNLSKAANTESWLIKVNFLEKAVKLYKGELLPGYYSNWLLEDRSHLAQKYSSTLSQLVSLYESHRQYKKAIGHAQALIKHDSLHEPAYAQLMRLHALDDNRASALQTYQSCVSFLRHEMGVEPSRKLQGLHEKILNQEKITKNESLTGTPAPLVGRDNSWQYLQRAWHSAINKPHIVLIRGEAGIGKTRLAEAFSEWVTLQGGLVLNARCYATEANLAYAPIITWLRSTPLSHLDSSQLIELSRFLPEIEKKHPHLPKPEPILNDWKRVRLFEALECALFSGNKAIMLFLDDLQWCDPETLDWLSFVLSATRTGCDQPQLLILTALQSDRAKMQTRVTNWESVLTQTNQLTTLELDRLNQNDTFSLATIISDHSIDPNIKTDLYTITEGHPYFVVELLRAAMPLSLDRMKQLTTLSSIMPDKVRHVLEAHLNQLSPLAREVIEHASVIGRSFSYVVLSELTQLNEDELVGCIDECWGYQVIRELDQDTYDFWHNKLHEITYDGISLTRKRWLHRQVAKILENIHVEELGRVAGIIAFHYENAGFYEQAISYYDLDSQTAIENHAHDEALKPLEKTLSLLDQKPIAGNYTISFASVQERIGDINVKKAQYHSAFQAYQSSMSQIPTTDLYAQARLSRKMGNALKDNHAEYQLVADQYQQAAIVLSQPSIARDQTWWEAWCDLQLDQMELQCNWHEAEGMEEKVSNIQSDIETHGTQIQKAIFYKHLMFFNILRNRFISTNETVQLAHKSLETLPNSAGVQLFASHQFALGYSLLWYGDYDEAISILQKAFKLSEEIGDIEYQARCLAYLVLAHQLMNQALEVEKTIQTCLSIAEEAKLMEYIGVSKAGMAWLTLRCPNQENPSRTSLSEARNLAQQAITAWGKSQATYPFQWQALWLLLYIAMLRSQLVEAIYHARQLVNLNLQAQKPEIEEKLTTALTAWNKGSRDKTRELLNQALINARQMNFI